ncbi:MAG: Spx/MgsR family RNA polymerase-binding regulatory protein [Bifidobacterium minimum]|nr:Spx/MgsR family RNA polymerase-binding regulatory protein [Bifidobacterium minimum]
MVSAAVNDGPRSTAAHPVVLYCHRPCSTCDKARAWLDDNAIAYREIEIALHNPDAERLGMWLDLSGLPIRRLFNTSGRLYRSRNISSRLDGMSRDEALAVLASDGMMVRRPVLEYADGVLIGFKPKEWRDALLSYRRGIRV